MYNSTPPSTSPQLQPQPQPQPVISELSSAIFSIPNDPTCSSSLFDWSDFLDFDLDDPFSVVTFDSDQPTTAPEPEPEPEPVLTGTDDTGKIRKRDERLVCPNFLAGRIPCACPELDEMLEQEEELMRGGKAGKKRSRGLKASAGSKSRCQVPECEADISELKGYHKRHRVCLRCAHASTVVLDGQDKRYCQQCGKFHILSDFDEGKRSCRRKLERHNNRRRRKPADCKGVGETESKQTTLSEDVGCEDDMSKDLSSQNVDKEPLIESEGQVSTLGSAHDSNNIQGDGHGVQSFTAFGEAQINGKNENPKSNPSISYDDKTAFSSVCGTGRISFKLYDWNPAEFPRRLRNQIFQWLANMPVELEGYIRPGCIILTMFIAMPNITWIKLSEDPAVHLHDFINSPGNLLSGRANFLAYLNNLIFSIVEGKGGTSVVQLNVKEHAPKLHYVHPTCFEAGRPLEFVACGSNLLQRKFRFLLSFAGKYLAYDLSVLLSREYTEDDASSSTHQLLKVSFSQEDPNLFGPAFVEVENEFGISNFIPILIANKEICSEMKNIEQRLVAHPCPERPEVTSTSLCQVSALRQARFSELITEVAWFIKNPVLENTTPWTRTQIERTNKLLNFLIESESTATLDRILYSLNTCMDNKLSFEAPEAGMEHLQMSMHKARLLVNQKLHGKGNQVSKVIDMPSANKRPELTSESMPLLNKDMMMATTIDVKDRPLNTCSPLFTRTVFMSRPFVLAMTATMVCLGLCAALLHPQKASELAVTIRRCIST